jgi:hypothetical protein
MLGVSQYTQDYVDATRARVRDQVAAYRALPESGCDAAALDEFAPRFFDHMVIALDAAFVHRLRNKELKDGNPLNEVRLLASSILTNDGVLLADKQIKLKPDTSLLGFAPGDRIVVDADGFERLAEAFLADVERKYVEVSSPA